MTGPYTVIFTTTDPPQGPIGLIIGRLLDGLTGQPFAGFDSGASASLFRVDAAGTRFVVTALPDGDGVFRITRDFNGNRIQNGEFKLVAQADGFPYAVRLDRREDVPRVVREFIEFKGPAFLEVIIDPDAGVYPMVGPGQGYDEMITGDHIPSRYQAQGREPDASEMF